MSDVSTCIPKLRIVKIGDNQLLLIYFSHVAFKEVRATELGIDDDNNLRLPTLPPALHFQIEPSPPSKDPQHSGLSHGSKHLYEAKWNSSP